MSYSWTTEYSSWSTINNIQVSVIEPEREYFTQEQITKLLDFEIVIVLILWVIVFYNKVIR